ncbi:hypothetical protein ACFO9Q_09210 [Paenibacillus sp. GCM10023252]|uniref:hypothetical protein n=1 Tax=Paenibacillus sp. GCM10023252 TaxID=3252649 RepID=UPI00361F86BE
MTFRLAMPSPEPLPVPDSRYEPLRITHIECYVVPSHCLNNQGFRAVLKVTTTEGTCWSELPVLHQDRPGDWMMWCGCLMKGIGVYGCVPEHSLNCECRHELQWQLYDQALSHIVTPAHQPPWTTDYDEKGLFESSLFYASFF